MATFRVDKNKNYTVMSNIHLRDRNLSLKAKGLLSMMLSLPEEWDYSIEGLVSICKENETSIKTTLKELKKYGYLEVIKLLPNQTDSGRIEYVYNIYETPKKQEGEKQEVENLPLENLPVENLGVEVQAVENQGQLNTNILNTDYLNTNNKTYSHLNHEGYREPISHNTIEPEATIDQGMYQEPEGFSAARQDPLNFKEESIYFAADEELNTAFTRYLNMRKLKNSPVPDGKAMRDIMTDLKNLSDGDRNKAIDILEQSIKYSWSSLHPLMTERISPKQQQESQLSKLMRA